MRRITRDQARRIALGAQGFADPKPRGRVDVRHLRRVLRRIGLLQLDSVNVVVRSHYMPIFSRLGPYDRDLLDDMAYRRRELFEYWGHVASLLPMDDWPLWQFRMDAIEMGRRTAKVHEDHPEYLDAVLEEVARHGPLTVAELEDPGSRSGPWWGHGKGKTTLEWHFAKGRVTVADRRNFTRHYDIPERVVPAELLDRAAPAPDEARAILVERSARHLGVATASDLADYYRLPVVATRQIVAGLEAAGTVQAVDVEGWDEPGYLHGEATIPRQVTACALLTPFDPVVWKRDRAERLYDFLYRIEIYVPEPKRQYGYYVMPFLLGDDLVARVDLKADRQRGRLRVPGAFGEPEIDRPAVARALAAELQSMAGWLGLGEVAVGSRGDLVGPLRRAL